MPEQLPSSYLGTKILDKRYDLIRIDFEAEHPPFMLRNMSDEEIITRTDQEAAIYIKEYLSQHAKVCSDCPDDDKKGIYKSY